MFDEDLLEDEEVLLFILENALNKCTKYEVLYRLNECKRMNNEKDNRM